MAKNKLVDLIGISTFKDKIIEKITNHTSDNNVHISSEEKTNLSNSYSHSQSEHAPTDAEKNVIVGVQKNGTDLEIDETTRKVDIVIPTKLSEFENDLGLSSDGESIIVDTELSETSENPVQNKVIKENLDSKLDKQNPSATGSLSLNRQSGTTIGEKSIAIGDRTTATGKAALAEGCLTEATGSQSHAEGDGTKALKDNSHSEGTGTIAQWHNQHVQGRYNVEFETEEEAKKYAHIVGGGTYNNGVPIRKDIHRLDWNGNAEYAGDIVATKEDGTKISLIGLSESYNTNNTQSDWNETNENSHSFIKNKPTTMPASDVHEWAKEETKPTYTASEVGADVQGSANAALEDAKSYVDEMIDALVGEGASTTLDTIGEISQAIEEHKEVTDALNAAIGAKASASDLTSHTGDSVVHITATERSNWNDAKEHASSTHAPSNAQSNVIETVKVNGTTLTPSSKAVDITVPTKLSDLTNDAGFKTTDNDTKNTAGSTDSSSKLYLIGATSQAANPQTYSHNTAYVGTDGHLYSDSKQVVNLSGSQALTNKTYNGYTLGTACTKGVATSVTSGNSSLVTSGAVYTAINSAVGDINSVLDSINRTEV